MINEELLNKIITEEINRELLSEFNFGGRMGSWLTNQNTGNVLGAHGGINFRNGAKTPNGNVFTKIGAALNPKNWAWNRERNFVQKTGMSFQEHADALIRRLVFCSKTILQTLGKLNEIEPDANKFLIKKEEQLNNANNKANNNNQNNTVQQGVSNPANGNGNGPDSSGGQHASTITMGPNGWNTGTFSYTVNNQNNNTQGSSGNTSGTTQNTQESISKIEDLMMLLEWQDDIGGGDTNIGWSKEHREFNSLKWSTTMANEQIYKNLCNLLVLCKSSNKFFGNNDTCVKNYDQIQRLCLQGGTLHKQIDDVLEDCFFQSQMLNKLDLETSKNMNTLKKGQKITDLQKCLNSFKSDLENFKGQVKRLCDIIEQIENLGSTADKEEKQKQQTEKEEGEGSQVSDETKQVMRTGIDDDTELFNRKP